MPSLPRTRPEIRWERALPLPRRNLAPSRLFNLVGDRGSAFAHANTLWLTPGPRGRDADFGEWPALLGLDLASGEERVRIPGNGISWAQAAPFGEHIALAVFAPTPVIRLVHAGSGRVDGEITGLAPAPGPFPPTNLVVAVDGGTLVAGWSQIERTPNAARGRWHVAAVRDGRVAWHDPNVALRDVGGGALVGMREADGPGGESLQSILGLAVVDGVHRWTRPMSDWIGLFGDTLVTRTFSPEGPQRHPSYVLAGVDPTTGTDRWSVRRGNISRITLGTRRLAATVDNGEPLLLLDETGAVALEVPKWADPARSQARAITALDDEHVLWTGGTVTGEATTACSPLVEPAANIWSIPDSIFAESAVFFDGGFVNFRGGHARAYLGGGRDA